MHPAYNRVKYDLHKTSCAILRCFKIQIECHDHRNTVKISDQCFCATIRRTLISRQGGAANFTINILASILFLHFNSENLTTYSIPQQASSNFTHVPIPTCHSYLIMSKSMLNPLVHSNFNLLGYIFPLRNFC